MDKLTTVAAKSTVLLRLSQRQIQVTDIGNMRTIQYRASLTGYVRYRAVHIPYIGIWNAAIDTTTCSVVLSGFSRGDNHFARHDSRQVDNMASAGLYSVLYGILDPPTMGLSVSYRTDLAKRWEEKEGRGMASPCSTTRRPRWVSVV